MIRQLVIFWRLVEESGAIGQLSEQMRRIADLLDLGLGDEFGRGRIVGAIERKLDAGGTGIEGDDIGG